MEKKEHIKFTVVLEDGTVIKGREPDIFKELEGRWLKVISFTESYIMTKKQAKEFGYKGF